MASIGRGTYGLEALGKKSSTDSEKALFAGKTWEEVPAVASNKRPDGN
jgi:hypothetical protein